MWSEDWPRIAECFIGGRGDWGWGLWGGRKNNGEARERVLQFAAEWGSKDGGHDGTTGAKRSGSRGDFSRWRAEVRSRDRGALSDRPRRRNRQSFAADRPAYLAQLRRDCDGSEPLLPGRSRAAARDVRERRKSGKPDAE